VTPAKYLGEIPWQTFRNSSANLSTASLASAVMVARWRLLDWPLKVTLGIAALFICFAAVGVVAGYRHLNHIEQAAVQDCVDTANQHRRSVHDCHIPGDSPLFSDDSTQANLQLIRVAAGTP